MDQRNWDNYYQITKDKTLPRRTLLKAIEFFNRRNQFDHTKAAIDLGCGSGVDSIELLKNGWSVFAIDSQAEAVSTLLASCPKILQHKLKTRVTPFELLTTLPKAQLINASYSLPFLNPENFYKFWKLILSALPAGGLFAGTFFGINDGWHGYRTDMTFLSTKELHNLFALFEMILLEEDEGKEADAMGFMKYWHRYFIVAEKRKN